MLNLTEALKRGINPERPATNSVAGLAGLKGMRPCQEGLKKFKTLTKIADSDIWPLCSAHRLIGEDVLYHENGVSNTSGLIGYEGNRYGIPHIADFYDFWLSTDGATTHVRRSMDDEDIYRYTTPQIQTCCARKESQLILGGFDNAFGYVDWTSILAAYNSAKTVGAPGKNWVWGSSIGAADWMMFFDDELHGDWEYWTGHWRERVEFYADLWKRNQMFMRPMPWRGYVWNVKPLGDAVMVYGQDGIAALTWHDSGVVGMRPIQRFPSRLGLMGRDTVSGSDDVHVMQSSDGDLWQITPDLTAQNLRYKWVLPSETTGNRSAMSFEEKEQEFYIANADESTIADDDVVYDGVVRYVDASSASGAPDGTTWADAYTTIQEAIDDLDANRGSDYGYVIVKSGTYQDDTVDEQVITAKGGIYVLGGFSGTGLAKSGETVVDGESARRCVAAVDETEFIFFSGITFENGLKRTGGGPSSAAAGAFAIEDVNGTYFVNCKMNDMGAGAAAGENTLYIYQSVYSNAPVLILNCSFDGNTIYEGAGSTGVICYDSWKSGRCTVESCTFANQTIRSLGVIYGVSRDSGETIGVDVFNCEFDSCESLGGGALVYVNAYTGATLRGCYAHENEGYLIRGTATNTYFHVLQSEFAYNTDDAIFVHTGTDTAGEYKIDGCYIHHNDAGSYGVISGYTNSLYLWRKLTISNTIMTGNTDYDIYMNNAITGVGEITIENCRLYGSTFIQTASSGTHVGSLGVTNTYIADMESMPFTVGSYFAFTNSILSEFVAKYDILTCGNFYFSGCTASITYNTAAGGAGPTNWNGWSGGAPTNATFTGNVSHSSGFNTDVPPGTIAPYTSTAYSTVELEDTAPYPDEDETDTGSLCVITENVLMLGQWRLVDDTSWNYSLDSGALYIMTGLTPGIHVIEFRDITGWNKPMRIRAMVRPGRTTFVYQDYFANRTGVAEENATAYMLNQYGLCQHNQAPIGFIGDQFCGIETTNTIEIVTPNIDMGTRQTGEKSAFVDMAIDDPDKLYATAYERNNVASVYTARPPVAFDSRGRARVKSTAVDLYIKVTADEADFVDSLQIVPIEQKDSGR